MPALPDHALVVLFVVLLPLYAKLVWYPRLKKALSAGVANARLVAFVQGMTVQWAIAVSVLIVWSSRGRSLDVVGLTGPVGVRFWIGMGIVALLFAAITWQRIAIVRSPEASAKVLDQLGAVRPLLADNLRDLGVFVLVSVTAGFCEELMFRGVLIWYLSAYVPVAVACVLAVALFGLAHFYQGRKGMWQSGAMGALFLGLVFVSESLWPAILFHTLFDVNSGLMGYTLLARSS